MVVVGHTDLAPVTLLAHLLALETRLGRTRPSIRNAPRVIDLDLILHGATRVRSPALTLPHPRAAARPFVIDPLRACNEAAAAFVASAA
jgi:2-amino-4-hydroxy-6-hydroxymethyldihydropteridine diphosphokinase